MEYIKATSKEADKIYALVQDTIRTIYPQYYPREVVDFFCEHHCRLLVCMKKEAIKP